MCIYVVGVVFILSLRYLPQFFGQYRYDLYYPYFFAFFGLGSVTYFYPTRVWK